MRHSLSYTSLGVALLVVALVCTLPYWIAGVGGYTQLATKILVMGLAALSVNYLLGYMGILSFGHAAYFGIAGYATGLILKYQIGGVWVALLVGIVAATIVAGLVSPLMVRLRGIYFAMVTIAIGQLFYFIAFQWHSLTGGDDGLSGFARAPVRLGPWLVDITQGAPFYYWTLAVVAVFVLIVWYLLHAPIGKTMVAIRDNERRARFLGIDVNMHVALAFTISGCVVGAAGSLNALMLNFVDPRALHWTLSGAMVIMAVIGGKDSFWGPFVGAAIFVVIQEYVSSYTSNWMFVLGVFFVLIVLLLPGGVLSIRQRYVR